MIENEDKFYLSGDNIILSGGGDNRENAKVNLQSDGIVTVKEAVDLLLFLRAN